MDVTEMRELVERHLKAEGAGDVEGAVAVYTDDVTHDAVGFPGSPRQGKDAAREFYRFLTANFRTEEEQPIHQFVMDDALGDLNRSTNRLRRKFDPLDKWMETRPQVESVLDDARKINQVMVRGKYGTQAERYWAVLRESINDLARCYNLTPLSA